VLSGQDKKCDVASVIVERREAVVKTLPGGLEILPALPHQPGA
jgi:hypothetical protein